MSYQCSITWLIHTAIPDPGAMTAGQLNICREVAATYWSNFAMQRLHCRQCFDRNGFFVCRSASLSLPNSSNTPCTLCRNLCRSACQRPPTPPASTDQFAVHCGRAKQTDHLYITVSIGTRHETRIRPYGFVKAPCASRETREEAQLTQCVTWRCWL